MDFNPPTSQFISVPEEIINWLIYLGLGLGVILLIILWRVAGVGPRRWRRLKQARRLLQAGTWQEAMVMVRRARQIGSPSASWRRYLDEEEAKCLSAGSAAALGAKQFEEALDHAAKAGQLRGQPEIEARALIQSAMLAEMIRLFSTGSETRAVLDLASRALIVQSPCREASFWQGLCHIRQGETEKAIAALQTARTGEALSILEPLEGGAGAANAPIVTAVIDPPLYLGALLLLNGQAKEALRYLTEANRIDANCPFVLVLLGSAIIMAGGDQNVAVRALQRGLGHTGLGQWEGNPQRAWVEAFPEGRSYIRKLAEKYPFICPLWGGDLSFVERQGNLALAQGLYKVANYQEAADLFAKALKAGAPSLTVLRGLGLSLARIGKYDDAFKHLATAYEMEVPKERLTAGYLAMCGARGTPTQETDLPRNIAWAIKTVTEYTAPGDAEWVALISAIFAEARAHKVPMSQDDQVYLCEHLWSVRSVDPLAAQAFHELQATYPHAMTNEYAWLYCRAAQLHQTTGSHALEMFARTFADAASAQAFFGQEGWDFEAVEFNYLRKAAAEDPGHFPEVLGPDYPRRGEEVLLARSRREELAGQTEAALNTATILVQLAPTSGPALDHLAKLCHRQGKSAEAVKWLETWRRHHPQDATPLIRLGILAAQQGQLADSQLAIRQALALRKGPGRTKIGLLGARITLQALTGHWTDLPVADLQAALQGTEEFLLDSFQADNCHPETLWQMAAVRWLRGDLGGLAQEAPRLANSMDADPRIHYFAALARLAGNDFAGVLEICPRIAKGSETTGPDKSAATVNGQPESHDRALNWSVEADYLAGLAHLGLGRDDLALAALSSTAQHPESPSMVHSLALLGWICYRLHRHEEASRWWQKLDAKVRSQWGITETLGGTVFLTALEAFAARRYEEAAEKLRQAGRLGCRDRRLGPLLLLSLFKGGQQAIYDTTSAAG